MRNWKSLVLTLGILFVYLSMGISVFAEDVFYTVDPPDRLMNSFVAGEWATAGNLDGWTGSSVSGLASTGGYLTGTGSASSPYVQKSNFAGGPDLDFGYFDYLQIRIKVPSTFNDDIIIYFGTTTYNGYDSSRMFTIPLSVIVKDGNWHSYRLDLGLVMWWRDTLRDIRIFPLGNSGNGQTFYIDYVEVGDKPGDVLIVNTDVGLAEGETLADTSRMESKHAVFWWSPTSYVIDSGLNPSVMGRRALRMIEESYQVYCKKMGFQEPFESWDLWRRNGNRYKVNHTTWFGGFWMGGRNGFGWLNVPAGGLWDEGRMNPVPHEFGHVLDGHQINFLTGGHWESHANHLRNNRNMYFSGPLGSIPTDIGTNPFEFSGFRQDHGRLIYADYRIHQALQDYADDLGLDPYISAKLWYQGVSEKTVYDKLSDILPGGYNVPDVVTFGLRHWPFLDFPDGSKMATELWSSANVKAWWYYITGSLLIPCQDKPGLWRAPFERSPERFAYMYHELDPTDTAVTVEFTGLDVKGSTEGWRWSLAAMNTSGAVRYSDVWSPGTQSFTLNAGETKVYLIVVATPTNNSLNLEWTDNRFPVDKHSDRLHYPYEVRIVGATPAKRQLQWAKGAGSYLPSNQGGGWKDNSAYVASTAWVGPNAMVLGSARVEGYGRVEDYAVIMGSARVQNYATVSGYAVLRDSARARNYAKVRDRAVLAGNSIAEETSVVEDYAHLSGSTKMQSSSIARGVTTPWAGTVSGTAILSYDYSMAESLSDGVHFDHVPWGDWYIPYWVSTKAKPRGLVASYRTEETDGQIWWDEFGDQHAVLRGTPLRIDNSDMSSKALRLDGVDDYVVLDRSLCDFAAATYGLWVKPVSNLDKPLLFMGGSATKYLKLELDSTGKAKFTITNGTITKQLLSTTTIPTGLWTHLAVTLNGTAGTLYVNGVPEASATISLSPDDCLGANDYTQPEAFYVGRDWAGNLFSGDIEDARFCNVVLTQSELDNEIRRSGNCIGSFYLGVEQNFDGAMTEVQSGVRNGVVRVLEATIYPRTSDNVAYYEGILDSSDERDGAFEGSGFGLDNREILVRLDNVGFWRTGIYVTLNQWQTITVSFDGSNAKLYVDYLLKKSTTYSASENDIAGKNYRIGCAQQYHWDEAQRVKYYFDGLMKDVFIYDKFGVGDINPPTPNPATFAIEPFAIGKSQITMTATTGSDSSGQVQYYFTEITGHRGGSDSGWQSDPEFTDNGLMPSTEYQYTVKMKDRYGNETAESDAFSAVTDCAADFDDNGLINGDDLQLFMADWLYETIYLDLDANLLGYWSFDESGGTIAFDIFGWNNAEILGGASLDGSGQVSLDGVDDYVSLPIGSVIASLTNCTIAGVVDFSNDTGPSQRIFDFGRSMNVYMYLSPRIGTDGPMRFAITVSGSAGEQQVTSASSMPSGIHHVAVTFNADADTVTIYLDGMPVGSSSSITRTPSSLGTTTNNWLGRSQYSSDGYFKGAIADFRIYDFCLTAEQALLLAQGLIYSPADFDMSTVVDFIDFAAFANCWLE